MTILITGGAGFIGRWVVKEFLKREEDIVVLDNLSNSNEENIKEFRDNPHLKKVVFDDIKNIDIIEELFSIYNFSICVHLAAQINVQESLDNPKKYFEDNVSGTFNLLETARKYNTKIILIGTCMVYNLAKSNKPISENHEVRPSSPYAASKLAAEELALSYYYGYDLPVVILRPFNTYGPFQKSDMDGGVVSIFVNKKLKNEKLLIYGTGNQTRDLLFVEDCARFIVTASESKKCIGEIINAGTGRDISINELALLISGDINQIEHINHHHPQSEIMKLVCDRSKAEIILNWKPEISLEKGIQKLEEWIKKND